MTKKIGDLTLEKYLGAGAYGEVYLSTKTGRKEYFATKKISRKIADSDQLKKYIENEMIILHSLKHPNIIRLEEIKKTSDYYYIVMECANGGDLSGCLKKYKLSHNGRAFSEEIVQHLMRQIIDGLKYIHKNKVIHRDLKSDNIMVTFDNENDKNNLNLLNAKVKIIDFGLAIKVSATNLAKTYAGSPLNMAPDILKKKISSCAASRINQFETYDEKVDIWSIGTVCYELLIGEPIFNAESFDELVRKVEGGNYVLPTNLSKEVVSFLNAMIQYKSEYRLSAEELANHPFLTKRVSDFTKIDTRRVSKKIDQKGLNINFKKNRSIWAIFNEEDEKKLINIKEPKNKKAVSQKNINRTNPQQMNINNNIPRQGTLNNYSNPYNQGFNMYPGSQNQMIYPQNVGIQRQSTSNYPVYGGYNNNYPVIGNNFINQPYIGSNINSQYNPSNINSQYNPSNISSQYGNYRPQDNDDSEEDKKECIIF